MRFHLLFLAILCLFTAGCSLSEEQSAEYEQWDLKQRAAEQKVADLTNSLKDQAGRIVELTAKVDDFEAIDTTSLEAQLAGILGRIDQADASERGVLEAQVAGIQAELAQAQAQSEDMAELVGLVAGLQSTFQESQLELQAAKDEWLLARDKKHELLEGAGAPGALDDLLTIGGGLLVGLGLPTSGPLAPLFTLFRGLGTWRRPRDQEVEVEPA